MRFAESSWDALQAALWGIVAALLFGMASLAYAAEPVCYEATGANGLGHTVSGHYGSYEAAASAWIGGKSCVSDGSESGCLSLSVGSCSPAGTPSSDATSTCQINGAPSGNPGSSSYNFNIEVAAGIAAECPENDCPTEGTEAFIGGGSSPGTACVNGCQYSTPLPALSVGGPSGSPTIYRSASTGQICDGSEPQAKQGSCVSGAGGRYCASTSNTKNCGTFNGDRVCVESIPPGTCVGYASGGVACAADAEEKPDNGTEGVDATPNGEVKKDGQTVNYYNSSTVSNSSNSITTTNNNGGSGSGSDEGDGDESEDIPGGVELPGLEELDGYDVATQDFLQRVEAAPLVSGLSGIAAAIPEGTCPTWEVSVFGQEVTLDQMCTILEDGEPVIAACMMFAWLLVGARVFFTA